MPNTNCLENIKCPSCGKEESFRIQATAVFTVTDDGTDDYTAVEWDDDSYAECAECHRYGALRDFRTGVSLAVPSPFPADTDLPADGSAKKPYSVLLLYPQDVNDSGAETYYAFVEAPDAIEAVAVARHEAVAAQEECAEYYEPDDFALEEMQNGATPCGLPFTFAQTVCPPSDAGNAPLIIRSGETTAAGRIVVPAGSPLIAGRVYLRLYHGRRYPAEEMDDWGFVGPTFGPLASVVQTYLTHFRLYGDNDVELWLETHDDMVVWQGSYYGDLCIFIAGTDDHG